MERILTQDEIDELLSAVEDGQIDVKLKSFAADGSAASLYDLKNISSINLAKGQNYSKWRIASLDNVFNAFARYYGMSLSNIVQRSMFITKGEIASKYFEDSLSDLHDTGVIGIFSLNPLKGNGLLIFNKALAFALVEMMFGVSAESAFVFPDRELTAIEANVIRSLMSEGCDVLNRAFGSLGHLDSKITKVETSWKFFNALSAETEVIHVSYSVQIGELNGEIKMIIPYFSLEPFREMFRGDGIQISESTQESDWAKSLEREVMNMEISISAILGELYLTIHEILRLQDGDIITFDYEESAPIKVMACHKEKYIAQPGLHNGKRALRLVKQVSLGE